MTAISDLRVRASEAKVMPKEVNAAEKGKVKAVKLEDIIKPEKKNEAIKRRRNTIAGTKKTMDKKPMGL